MSPLFLSVLFCSLAILVVPGDADTDGEAKGKEFIGLLPAMCAVKPTEDEEKVFGCWNEHLAKSYPQVLEAHMKCTGDAGLKFIPKFKETTEAFCSPAYKENAVKIAVCFYGEMAKAKIMVPTVQTTIQSACTNEKMHPDHLKFYTVM